MARAPAFQAGHAGSIPVTRSARNAPAGWSTYHATRDGGGGTWRLACLAVATDFRSDGPSAASQARELPVVDLIGRGLIERCYGAPYDPAGIVATELALEHTAEVVI